MESLLPHPCHYGHPGLAYEIGSRHIERERHVPNGIKPRNRTRALALASQGVTYHGCVSSDESRAVQKSHIYVPPS
jgi:hypothetical protein